MCRVCVRDTVSIYVHPVVYGFILICVFVECQYSIEMKCVCVLYVDHRECSFAFFLFV